MVVEHLSAVLVFSLVLSVDTSCKAVCVVIWLRYDWIMIGGKFGMVWVNNRETLQDGGLGSERAAVPVKTLRQMTCRCGWCHWCGYCIWLAISRYVRASWCSVLCCAVLCCAARRRLLGQPVTRCVNVLRFNQIGTSLLDAYVKNGFFRLRSEVGVSMQFAANNYATSIAE